MKSLTSIPFHATVKSMMEQLTEYIIALGYVALFAAVFAESGLFFGFFLPGDSLLFAAGLFAAKGDFNIIFIGLGCFLAAVAGDQVGYWFGVKVGRKFYGQKDSFFFRQEHVEKTKEFYEKHGTKTLILARFVPIVRTFAPIVAGVAGMNYPTFLRFNLIGGFLWSIGLPFLGYRLGQSFPQLEEYLMPIIIVIIILSVIPALVHLKLQKK